jgi:hypothetical protein
MDVATGAACHGDHDRGQFIGLKPSLPCLDHKYN